MPSSTPPDLLRRADLARSRWAAGLLLAPLLIGLAVRVEEGRATLLGLEGPGCVAGRWVGDAGCPGCGLTRSTALTLRGDLGAAAALNWAGPLLVLACVLGLALHLDVLLRARRRTRLHARLLSLGARGLTLAVLLAWITRWFHS